MRPRFGRLNQTPRHRRACFRPSGGNVVGMLGRLEHFDGNHASFTRGHRAVRASRRVVADLSGRGDSYRLGRDLRWISNSEAAVAYAFELRPAD